MLNRQAVTPLAFANGTGDATGFRLPSHGDEIAVRVAGEPRGYVTNKHHGSGVNLPHSDQPDPLASGALTVPTIF